MITDDIFLVVLQYSNFETIIELCKINKNFYILCKNQPKMMEKIKRNGLVRTLNENEKLVRKFASDFRYIFEEDSGRNLRIQGTYHILTVYDKVWIQIMFLLNIKKYKKAETLINSFELTEPPFGIFFQKSMVEMPPKLMKNLWLKFGNVLDLAGYENKQDFLMDHDLRDIKNPTLRKIIESQLI